VGGKEEISSFQEGGGGRGKRFKQRSGKKKRSFLGVGSERKGAGRVPNAREKEKEREISKA